MKRLILALIFLLLPVSSWSAGITTTGSGEFNSTTPDAPWPSGTIPSAGDDVIVAAAHTLTVPTGYETPALLSITTTGHATTPGILVVNGKITATNYTIGNNDSTTTSTLTSGPESEISIGTNLLIRAAIWNSTATSGSWGKVTGAGTINSTPAIRHNAYDLRYVSFQNTGNSKFAVGTLGIITNSINIRNCTFSSTGTLQFGEPSYFETTEVLNVSENDFYNTGNITITGKAGTPAVTNNFRNNTLFASSSTPKTIRINNRIGVDFSGSVLHGYAHDPGTANPVWDNVFISFHPSQTAPPTSLLIGTVSGAAITDSYIYTPPEIVNPHVVSFNPTSGTASIRDSIIEMHGASGGADGGNAIIFGGGGTYTAENNIHIGQGMMFSSAGNVTYSAVINHNTSIVTETALKDKPTGFYLFENGYSSGNISIKNNIGFGVTTDADYFIYDDNVGTDQTIATYGYNNIFNVTSENTNCIITTDLGGGLTLDPNFLDISRTLAAWGATLGTDGTDDAAVALLLTINGYNSTSKTQSDTPSGVLTADLVTFVRAGATPRNMTLATSGESGTYIGAVEPVAADYYNGAAMLMGM